MVSKAADNFIEILGTLIVFAVPLLFILIAVGPFIYLWRKRGFNIRNVVLTLFGVVALETLYVYSLSQGIKWLAGKAFCDIYGC